MDFSSFAISSFGNVGTTSAVLTFEAIDKDPKDATARERQMNAIKTAIAKSDIPGLYKQTLGKTLIAQELVLAEGLAQRLAAGFGLMNIQKQKSDEPIEKKKHDDLVTRYDTIFFVGKMPLNGAVDRTVLPKFPSDLL